jgi:amino acid transporter
VAQEQGGELKREIGFTGSAFLSFNGLVGAGIFALPATLNGQFGAWSPWLFPLFGTLALVVALPFSRLAAYHPGSGGPVAYASVFGPLAAFQVGWIYYVARATALAANSNVFVTYAASLWPPIGHGAPRAVTILLVVGALTGLNMVGVRRAIRALDALTLLKAAPLIGIALYALLAVAPAIPAPGPPPPLSELEAAALLVFYAFVGFENSVVPAGETADPRRTIPRALIVTLLATMALYFLVQLAFASTMPRGAAGDAPLVAFGEAVAGPAGALLLTAAALFSLTGNIMGGLTGTPRATFALAQGGMLPAWFGRVSIRWGTPANSILFMGALIAVLALSGSFVWLAVVSTLARMIVYAASIAALPGTRRQAGEEMPLYLWVMVAAGLAVCAWGAAQSQWPSWRVLLVLIGLGVILFAGARLTGRGTKSSP